MTMVVGKVKGPTYAVLAQLTLVATAIFYLFYGRTQTPVGWFLLCGITLSMVGFNLASGASESSGTVVGYILLSGKIILSVVSGVMSDDRLKKNKAPFICQLMYYKSFVYIGVALTAWVIEMGLLRPATTGIKPFEYGFFSGPDGPWTWQVPLLGLYYVLTNLCICAILKHLDAIVKNIARALGLIVCYLMACAIFQSEIFHVGKMMWVLMVVLLIVTFSVDKKTSAVATEPRKESLRKKKTDEEEPLKPSETGEENEKEKQRASQTYPKLLSGGSKDNAVAPRETGLREPLIHSGEA
uniref:EamA domain-containing protein n=1 Tax=Chromera velia CCMP2878 TaxID=1169474 RepID=A0A0G4HYB5_9ALVE|eukprot:Cvel_33500.t1-p1 / transcript=Cvel_33500.t1 / gene=Cvel_33500 / organism=Chromera_velia_CCMP2878 / gene_product=hypothetical protein / transcript_product=hypothetical protein / location=Cvel_scaffold5457:3541-4431(+) / protein_length=297 / sequence_SO=supercontig / SO=protein_coding / is_pseudo=false